MNEFSITQDGLTIGNFQVYLNENAVYDDIVIACDTNLIGTFSFGAIDPYVLFKTETEDIQFPLTLPEHAGSGELHINISEALAHGTHVFKAFVDINSDAPMPVIGLCAAGLAQIGCSLTESINGLTPYIMVVSILEVGTPGQATSDEKLAIQFALKVWLDEVTIGFSLVSDLIDLLTEVSIAEDIYGSYEQARVFLREIPQVTMTSAIYSLQKEAGLWNSL